jgi:hypothetical protein
MVKRRRTYRERVSVEDEVTDLLAAHLTGIPGTVHLRDELLAVD